MDDLFLDTYYFFVLIETYWNVKVKHWKQSKARDQVLIETYWNVKTVSESNVKGYKAGINRNILECKDKRSGRIYDNAEY